MKSIEDNVLDEVLGEYAEKRRYENECLADDSFVEIIKSNEKNNIGTMHSFSNSHLAIRKTCKLQNRVDYFHR